MSDLVMVSCGACGVEFGMPEGLYRECQQLGRRKTWYCPNGHPRAFCEGEVDTLRRERDRLKQQLACRDDEIAAQRKQVIAAKGQITKLKKRAKAGVCPCCQRSFENLRRHMSAKHPEFDPAETGNVVDLKAGRAS